MAATTNGATGNFAIMLGAHPSMDARPGYTGYAAFGRVVEGMDVVRKILAQPIGAGSGPMKGQMILKPIPLIRAERIDGTPKPTGGVKPWLIGVKYDARPAGRHRQPSLRMRSDGPPEQVRRVTGVGATSVRRSFRSLVRRAAGGSQPKTLRPP